MIFVLGRLGAVSLEPAGLPRFLGAGGSVVSFSSDFSGNSSAFSDFSGIVAGVVCSSSVILE
jgi:hypothetical protein